MPINPPRFIDFKPGWVYSSSVIFSGWTAMTAKIKSSEWSDFSQRFVRIHGLPQGTELRLYRRSNGRRVRSDFSIKRKAVNRTNVAQLSGTDRVSDLLADAKAILSTDINARGLEMWLFGPDGNWINGNAHLQTVRNMEPTLQDNGEPIEAFLDLLTDAGIDDIPIRQAGVLYNRLRDVMGGDYFDKQLLRTKQ